MWICRLLAVEEGGHRGESELTAHYRQQWHHLTTPDNYNAVIKQVTDAGLGALAAAGCGMRLTQLSLDCMCWTATTSCPYF